LGGRFTVEEGSLIFAAVGIADGPFPMHDVTRELPFVDAAVGEGQSAFAVTLAVGEFAFVAAAVGIFANAPALFPVLDKLAFIPGSIGVVHLSLAVPQSILERPLVRAPAGIAFDALAMRLVLAEASLELLAIGGGIDPEAMADRAAEIAGIRSAVNIFAGASPLGLAVTELPLVPGAVRVSELAMTIDGVVQEPSLVFPTSG